MENEDILNSGIEPNNDLKDLMKELTALKNENDALKNRCEQVRNMAGKGNSRT